MRKSNQNCECAEGKTLIWRKYRRGVPKPGGGMWCFCVDHVHDRNDK